MNTLEELFAKLWERYCRLNPQARQIHDLLHQQGENIVNDHIALRTFDHPAVNIEVLAEHFKKFGYQEKGQYQFTQKKLRAKHFELVGYPRIFISELIVGEFSPFLQDTVKNLIANLSVVNIRKDSFLYSGRKWPMISYRTYSQLLQESEYAAWLATFGYLANHFTISVNDLTSFKDLTDLNTFLKNAGFTLNTAGGEVKGGAAVYLAQSSTLAAKVKVSFADRKQLIPGCYYEFAQRFRQPDGQWFNGFIAASADKIFESTDAKA